MSGKGPSYNKINMIGQQYGLLTVIKEAPTVNSKSRWLCQCKCGKTKIVYGALLRRGDITSCGCRTGRRLKDITGTRFGKLTVIEFNGYIGKKRSLWLCRCDCGKLKVAQGILLRQGAITSCGCGHGQKSVTHGHTRGSKQSLTYKKWQGMKRRCLNPHEKKYKDYGGRGITVCRDWLHFENFLRDMGECPSSNHSLERDNVDGNYEPRNCRWILLQEQALNKRTTRYVTYKGEKVQLVILCRRLGLDCTTVKARLKYGWSEDRALSSPIRNHRPYKNKSLV